MKAADRLIVFNKYGGKCAYCGCELTKGWHVDHAEPVIRNTQKEGRGYFHKESGDRIETSRGMRFVKMEDYEFREGKSVTTMERPENDTPSNYMPACASCNINKHSMDIEGFRFTITQFLESLNKYSTQFKFAKRYGIIEETGKPVVFYFETLTAQQIITT